MQLRHSFHQKMHRSASDLVYLHRLVYDLIGPEFHSKPPIGSAFCPVTPALPFLTFECPISRDGSAICMHGNGWVDEPNSAPYPFLRRPFQNSEAKTISIILIGPLPHTSQHKIRMRFEKLYPIRGTILNRHVKKIIAARS
jgi:hypothetical protein